MAIRIDNPPKKVQEEVERLAEANKRTVPAQALLMLKEWMERLDYGPHPQLPPVDSIVVFLSEFNNEPVIFKGENSKRCLMAIKTNGKQHKTRFNPGSNGAFWRNATAGEKYSFTVPIKKGK